MVYVFLADGFEEIEALAPVDILRRMSVDVKTVGVTGKNVRGSHGITVCSDKEITDGDFGDADTVILPGGLPGTTNLYNCEKLRGIIKRTADKGGNLAAICAAPSVFLKMGLLKGREYTCFPGFEDDKDSAIKKEQKVAISKGSYNVITSCSAGTALDFAFCLAEFITGDKEKVEDLKKSMIYGG